MSYKWTAAGMAVGVAALMAACGSGEGEDRPTVEIIGGAGSVSISGAVEGYGEELYESSTDQSLNLAIGLDLKGLRDIMSSAVSGDPVDWPAAEALYSDGKNQVEPGGSLRALAAVAVEMPATAFPEGEQVYGRPQFVDAVVRDGLLAEGRGVGLSDNSRRQIVDKGVQMIMYGQSIAHLADAEAAMAERDTAAAAIAIDAAWATLAGERDESGTPNNGLLATGLAREDDFSLQGRLSRPLEASLFSALTAAQQGNQSVFDDEVGASREYLNTILYLSTLRYAKVLEGDRRSGDREAHYAEGWTFFQAIRAQVAAVSPSAADTIEAAYSQPADVKFTDEITDEVYAALNEPAVLDALSIPEEFQFRTP